MKTLQQYLNILMISLASLNSAFASPVVIINEVLYDGPGGDGDDAFTELFGTPGLTLDGWSLTGTNGLDGSIYRSIDLSGVTIPDDGILVLATASATGAVLENRDFIADIDWQNGPDSIQLLSDSGEIVDALQYGDAGINNRGEGVPALDVSSGFSLSRNAFGADTDNNFNDFIPLKEPSPGVGPVIVSAPEPGAFALMGIGLLGLLGPGGFVRKRLI